jgi:hypothetical protein
LPALPSDRCAYHIFTPSADAETIRCAPSFQRLSALMPTHFESIDDVYRGHSYWAMTECHNRGLALGRGMDCTFVFLPPDALWSDGSLRRMHALISGGKRAVVLAGPRVTAEEVHPIVGSQFSPEDSSIRLTSREMAALLMRYVHPTGRAHFWENGSNLWAGQYYWPVGNSGMLIRATHLTPVAVRPVEREVRLGTNLDAYFVGHCCPDPSQVHVITDSDEMCALECSNADYLDGYYSDTPLSPEQHRTFLQQNTDAYHRAYLRRYIRIRAGEIGPEWLPAEAESDAVVEELLRDFAAHLTEVAPPPAILSEGERPFKRLGRLTRAVLDRQVKVAHLGPLDPGAMRPEGKHGFVVDLAELGVFAPSDKEFPGGRGARSVSHLVLLENGTPLGPAHQMHDVIRNKGRGRYSHWGTGLHFSTSDNSDPRVNGRTYTLRVPQTFAGLIQRGWWKVKKRLHAA